MTTVFDYEWWEVLECPRDAGTAVIRDAHRKVSLKLNKLPVGIDLKAYRAALDAARDYALKERGR